MKKVKTYKVFNESLRDKMKGKSNEDMLKSLDKLNDNEKIKAIIKNKLSYDLLPRKNYLFYDGNLNLSDSNIEELPYNLTVFGDLNLRDNLRLISLPYKLVVNGSLDCSYNGIFELPHDLVVTETLYCEDVLMLPKDIEKPKNVNKLIID